MTRISIVLALLLALAGCGPKQYMPEEDALRQDLKTTLEGMVVCKDFHYDIVDLKVQKSSTVMDVEVHLAFKDENYEPPIENGEFITVLDTAGNKVADEVAEELSFRIALRSEEKEYHGTVFVTVYLYTMYWGQYGRPV